MYTINQPNILNEEVPHQTYPDPALEMQEQAEKIISTAVECEIDVDNEHQLENCKIQLWPVSIEIDGNTFRDLKAEIKRVYEKDTLTDEEAIDFSVQLIKDWITYR
jgi:hypothetical protein